MEYYQPHHLEKAHQLLREKKGKARLIAGGTNVIPELRAKEVQPIALIDLSRLKSLSYIREDKKKIRIGALTTISDLASSKRIERVAPILLEATVQLGNPLVRNRATIGGNLADASPAADTAVPLLALEAEILTNQRRIPIDRFFTGPNKNVLKKDEIIKEIGFTKPNSHARMGYFKLGLRNAMAISVVSVAILMEMERDRCKLVRIGLGAVAPTPIRAYQTEERLTGQKMSSDLIEACCDEIQKKIRPITDVRATADYRRKMVSVILNRLIRRIALRESI